MNYEWIRKWNEILSLNIILLYFYAGNKPPRLSASRCKTMRCLFVSGCNKISALIRWTTTCLFLFLSFSSTFSRQLQLFAAAALVIRCVQCIRLLLLLQLKSTKVLMIENHTHDGYLVGTHTRFVSSIIPAYYTWVIGNNCFGLNVLKYIIQTRWWKFFRDAIIYIAVTDKNTTNNFFSSISLICVSRLDCVLFIYISCEDRLWFKHIFLQNTKTVVAG